ncbi:unnamed protein product [Linum tenue]|uniref:E3 ubiquitin-protein ligase PRT1 n=1 Tax=Linum tenue TaxID=586396 RepID=A0AAV0RU23_9ROSI|nr:unnamed protein product [Linum tenue]
MATPLVVASAAAPAPGPESEEEIPDSFNCCICLDLLYKPVVLACGHMACFWCVHLSMSFRSESHCPICRNSYHHFPAICLTLHFLLMKLYPIAYMRRQGQILEEEKERRCFSPQLDSNLAILMNADKCCDGTKGLTYRSTSIGDSSAGANEESLTSSTTQLGPSSVTVVTSLGERNPDESCGGNHSEAIEEHGLHQNKPMGNGKPISTEDVQCLACKQLLVLPVVLNCGHAFCGSCIIQLVDEAVKCQECGSLQPRGALKVCLEFDNFIAEQFPEEYQSRREAAQHAHAKLQNATAAHVSGSMESSKKDLPPLQERLLSWADPQMKVHRGIGCDACGMCPIIGERHRCVDCVEAIGFDLCGECYNSRSKLPGRFNQQHTPEHRFELVGPLPRSIMMMMEAHVFRQLGGVATNATNDFDWESESGSVPLASLSDDPQESTGISSLAEDPQESTPSSSLPDDPQESTHRSSLPDDPW